MYTKPLANTFHWPIHLRKLTRTVQKNVICSRKLVLQSSCWGSMLIFRGKSWTERGKKIAHLGCPLVLLVGVYIYHISLVAWFKYHDFPIFSRWDLWVWWINPTKMVISPVYLQLWREIKVSSYYPTLIFMVLMLK